MDETDCHVHSLRTMQEPLGPVESALQFANRVRRALRRRAAFASNVAHRLRTGERQEFADPTAVEQAFLPGERVRVKSADEIRRTLDDWNMLNGCGFMPEQWEYCGTEQTVFKHVQRFLDERDYKVKRVRKTYLLENVFCSGRDFGPCDRSCFFFWREEWLERIE